MEAYIDDNGNCCVHMGRGRCRGKAAEVIMVLNMPGRGYLTDTVGNALTWFGESERYPDWSTAVAEAGDDEEG